MLVIRIAENDPEKHAERATWLPAHQAHLRSGAIAVLQSGPLLSGETSYGALLVAEVEDLDALKRFSDADPFVLHRIYRRVELLRWTRTIG